MTQVFAVRIEDGVTRAQAHLAREDLDALGAKPGETARLGAPSTDARTTYVRLRPSQHETGALALDAMTARNAGLSPGAQAKLVPEPLGPLHHLLLRLVTTSPATPDDVREGLFDMSLTKGDQVALTLPLGRTVEAEVVECGPNDAGLVQEQTQIALETPHMDDGYDEVGGLRSQIALVKDMVELPLRRPELYARLSLQPPRGVLFTGPPGSGKTLLARAVAGQTQAAFYHVSGPEIVTKHYGESEAGLRKVFQAAEQAAPAIIFIDEIDAIAPARDALSGEKQVERRIVAQLLTLMDGLADRGRVVVMAATNLPDALDPALRRPGRFDREVAFTPPTAEDRAEILGVHLGQTPLDADVDFGVIAALAHGYVGADLAALTREAAVAALSRAIEAAGGEAKVNPQTLFVTQADLVAGLRATAPSALRGAEPSAEPVGFSDIGGLDEVKDALHRAILWPLQAGDAMRALRLSPARGVLLTGSPGSGKTLMARALASEAAFNFIPVRASALLSQYFGEAEKAVASLFRKARQTAPSVVFFDEFDALAPRRSGKDAALDRLVAQLLVELDGIEGDTGVVVLAATNRPGAIDPALIRSGRFDTVVEFPLPDRRARRAILDIHLRGRPVSPHVNPSDLAEALDGASGADIKSFCDTAARKALARRMQDPNADLVLEEGDFSFALACWLAEADARRADHLTKGDDAA